MKKITLLLAVLAFSFNAFAQPANDLCAGATPIVPSAAGTGCGTFTFTAPVATDGTTDSGVPTVCSTPGNDIWFTWTATSAGLIWNDGTGNPGIAIFANCTDAAAGTQIDCQGTFASIDAQLSGWTIGDNLIIQVYDFSGSSSDISFCLEEFTPPSSPVNDACAGALPITNGGSVTGTTAVATNVEALPDCANGGGTGTGCTTGGTGFLNFGLGVWYVYTSNTSETISIDTETSAFDTEVQVFSGACGSLVCVGGDDDGGTGALSAICWEGSGTMGAPVDYYIYVDGHATGTGAYTLSLTATATLSTTDFDSNESLFSFSPNPVNNILTLNAQKEISNVAVFNMLGQSVLNTTPNTLNSEVNMSNLQSGAYFVQVTIGSITEVVRVLKN